MQLQCGGIYSSWPHTLQNASQTLWQKSAPCGGVWKHQPPPSSVPLSFCVQSLKCGTPLPWVLRPPPQQLLVLQGAGTPPYISWPCSPFLQHLGGCSFPAMSLCPHQMLGPGTVAVLPPAGVTDRGPARWGGDTRNSRRPGAGRDRMCRCRCSPAMAEDQLLPPSRAPIQLPKQALPSPSPAGLSPVGCSSPQNPPQGHPGPLCLQAGVLSNEKPEFFCTNEDGLLCRRGRSTPQIQHRCSGSEAGEQ